VVQEYIVHYMHFWPRFLRMTECSSDKISGQQYGLKKAGNGLCVGMWSICKCTPCGKVNLEDLGYEPYMNVNFTFMDGFPSD
jgi:hypothetical protein